MPKPRKATTDLQALLGTASRSGQIQRPLAVDPPETLDTSTPVLQNITTPKLHDTMTPTPPDTVLPKVSDPQQERRINVAIRESLHKPLKLHAVTTDREVRDIVEIAIRGYLESIGAL